MRGHACTGRIHLISLSCVFPSSLSLTSHVWVHLRPIHNPGICRSDVIWHHAHIALVVPQFATLTDEGYHIFPRDGSNCHFALTRQLFCCWCKDAEAKINKQTIKIEEEEEGVQSVCLSVCLFVRVDMVQRPSWSYSPR